MNISVLLLLCAEHRHSKKIFFLTLIFLSVSEFQRLFSWLSSTVFFVEILLLTSFVALGFSFMPPLSNEKVRSIAKGSSNYLSTWGSINSTPQRREGVPRFRETPDKRDKSHGYRAPTASPSCPNYEGVIRDRTRGVLRNNHESHPSKHSPFHCKSVWNASGTINGTVKKYSSYTDTPPPSKKRSYDFHSAYGVRSQSTPPIKKRRCFSQEVSGERPVVQIPSKFHKRFCGEHVVEHVEPHMGLNPFTNGKQCSFQVIHPATDMRTSRVYLTIGKRHITQPRVRKFLPKWTWGAVLCIRTVTQTRVETNVLNTEVVTTVDHITLTGKDLTLKIQIPVLSLPPQRKPPPSLKAQGASLMITVKSTVTVVITTTTSH